MSALEIGNKLKETWTFCNGVFGDRCIALCLHGSQNYELDLPESDIDAKLILALSWEEVINCRKPISETIKGPYGDINLCDIRLFIGVNLEKQNFNFLETLFTPYCFVNPYYKDLWEELLQHREKIAHYKPDQAVRTMMGQVENQWHRWNRFDNKKTLYHMARIHSAIKRYQEGLAFADTLVPENAEWIMEVRLGKVDEETMENFFNKFYNEAHELAKPENYKGPEYPIIYMVMDNLKQRFVFRALYEHGVDN